MRTKTRLTLASLFIVSLSGTVLGQRAKLSGEVVENNVRKPNINVMVVGAGGVVTDVNGHFRIMLPNDHFIPGQPITIRVNGWKVFDPIFGQSTAQDISFPSPIKVSIIRPHSALAHKNRQRLGAIVAAMQEENRDLSKTLLALQKGLTFQAGRVEAITAEAARLREENQKYAFLRRYAEEYEIPLEAMKSALDDWARNKQTEDDLEAARQAYWRGDYALVVEITNRSETIDAELTRENRQAGLKLNRRRLDKHKLKVSALTAQIDFKGLYDAVKKLDGVFESRDILKEDFLGEWAENRLWVGTIAFFLQMDSDLKQPTIMDAGKSELMTEAVRAFRSVEDYYSVERSPNLWASLKVISALVYRYQSLAEMRDAKYLHEIIAALNEVLNARDANGKVITAERFPTEWALTQNMLGYMFYGLSLTTSGTESLKHLKAEIDVHRHVLDTSSGGTKVFLPEKFPQQWAQTQDSLASALLKLSRRTEGPESLSSLRDAVAAYKALFEATGSSGYTFFNSSYFGGTKVYTPEKFPLGWAKSQNDLGSALFELSRKVTGTESDTALAEAAAAYRAASDVRKRDIDSGGIKFATPDELLKEWASSQGWLSICLLELSRRTAGPDGLTHLTGSIAAARAVLEASNDGKKIFTPNRFPREWVGAQIDVGNGLVDLSVKTPGADGLTHALGALAAYKAILTAESGGSRIFVPERSPMEWVIAHRGVGSASAEVNRRVGGPTELSYLIDAVGAYKTALSATVGGAKILTPEALPTEWVLTQSALGTALTELSSKTQGQDSLKYQNEAIAAYEESFAASHAGRKVLSPESFPLQWVLNKNSLSQALIVRSRLRGSDDGLRDMNDALAASQAVLEASNQGAKICTPETFPAGWVRAQLNLAMASMDLSYRTKPTDRNRAQAAIDAATAVLGANKASVRIITPEAAPLDWLAAQFILADSHALLGAWDRTRDVDVEILRHFPDNKPIYLSLALIYSERLFLFEQAFDLHQQWLLRYPNDLEAQIGFATAHFKTGRFTECARRIETLLARPDLTADTAIGLRAVEIANLVALDRQHEVPGKFDALIKVVKDQPASFKLVWGFVGTKNRIDQVENMKPRRAWLHQLLDAFQSEDRDALLEALLKAQASWDLSSRSATFRIRKPQAAAP